MKENKKKDLKNVRCDPVQHRVAVTMRDTADHEMVKHGGSEKKSISDHAEIIVDALNDYRKWFTGKDDSDKETTKQIDDAIEFVQRA